MRRRSGRRGRSGADRRVGPGERDPSVELSDLVVARSCGTASTDLCRAAARHALVDCCVAAGSPLRWPEIAQANYGRPQPDGGELTDAHWIYPGWVLILPGCVGCRCRLASNALCPGPTGDCCARPTGDRQPDPYHPDRSDAVTDDEHSDADLGIPMPTSGIPMPTSRVLVPSNANGASPSPPTARCPYPLHCPYLGRSNQSRSSATRDRRPAQSNVPRTPGRPPGHSDRRRAARQPGSSASSIGCVGPNSGIGGRASTSGFPDLPCRVWSAGFGSATTRWPLRRG